MIHHKLSKKKNIKIVVVQVKLKSYEASYGMHVKQQHGLAYGCPEKMAKKKLCKNFQTTFKRFTTCPNE